MQKERTQEEEQLLLFLENASDLEIIDLYIKRFGEYPDVSWDTSPSRAAGLAVEALLSGKKLHWDFKPDVIY